MSNMPSEGQAEWEELQADLAQIGSDKKIQAHVKATEDAYRARAATMYDGEYAQLGDQVHAHAV